MKKKMLLLGFTGLATIAVRSQSIGPGALNTTGGSNTIAGNTYEFAIGGLSVFTYTGAGLVVTQDLLQPTTQTIGIDDKEFFANNLSLFPNPAEEVLFLQPDFRSGGKLSYSLYDMLGRVMQQANVLLASGKEKQSLVLKGLAASTYTLRVSYEQKGKTYSTSYKVQKLQ